MRRLFILGLLLCALPDGPATAVTPEREATLKNNVEQARQLLQQHEEAEKNAANESYGHYDKMNDYQRQAQWRLFRQSEFRNKANDENRKYGESLKKEREARAESEKVARDYLQAEQQYKNEVGTYLYPEKQEYWTGRIQEGGSAAGPGRTRARTGEPATTENLMKSVGGLQKTLLDSDMSRGGSVAAAENQSRQIRDMTDKLVASAFNSVASGSGGKTPGFFKGSPGRPFSDRSMTPPSSSGRLKIPALKKPAPKRKETADASRKKVMISPDRRERSKYAPRKRGSGGDLGFLRSGESKFLGGDLDGALRDAEEFIRRHPDDPLGYKFKAKILNRRRQFLEAAEAARRGLMLDPNDTEALRSLAWAQLHTKDYQGAIETTNKILEINPNDAQAYLMRAFAYERLGMRAAMLADLKRAAKLNVSYMNHYIKALNEEELFNPDNADSYSLLNELAYSPPLKFNSKIVFGGLLVFAALAAAALPALAKLFGPYLRRLKPIIAKLGRRQAAPALSSESSASVPPPPPAAEGAVLGGKYQLENVIGCGGMGRVWRAYDTSLDRPVAVKQTLTGAGEQDTMLRQLYMKEARTMAGLHHPNIVDIFEIIDRPDGVFLVLEYVSGKTLQQLLLQHGRLAWERTRPILMVTAGALVFAHHKGIIHRDLKPSNIMLDDRGYVKVMDFGIARDIQSKGTPVPSPFTLAAEPPERRELGAARTRTLAGTPAYMPPESYEGVISPATDTFALGVCLYEMLTGKTPFGDRGWSREAAAGVIPASRLAAGLDPRVDVLIQRALDPDRARRIATPGEFSARLRSID